MEFIGGNTDFCAQTIFKAIGKARAGVHHHAGGIDFAQKLLRVRVVIGQNRLGMAAAVAIDVGNRGFHAVHQFDADDGR